MALSSNPERTLLVVELLPIAGNPKNLVVGGSILQFFCLFQHLWKLFVRQCDVLEHEEHQSNLLHACYSIVRPFKLCVT